MDRCQTGGGPTERRWGFGFGRTVREVRARVGCPPDAAPPPCRRPAVASATMTCPGRPNPRERSRPVARRRRHSRPRPSSRLALRNVSTIGTTLPAHPRELSRPDPESHVPRGRPSPRGDACRPAPSSDVKLGRMVAFPVDPTLQGMARGFLAQPSTILLTASQSSAPRRAAPGSPLGVPRTAVDRLSYFNWGRILILWGLRSVKRR
ncbi:hypothetical protein BHE74_00012136 [Ensete ventricosum]|nr:hypothetical protein BHE74_00012136 [Ensete ventricosum]